MDPNGTITFAQLVGGLIALHFTPIPWVIYYAIHLHVFKKGDQR
jgi:hypothetical protein